MEEQLISFETAKLAQEKNFNVPCSIVFDLQNNNKVVDFREQEALKFIEDCETGFRTKGLNYFKEDYNRKDDNKDLGYFITRPTQSLLQKWLREVHGIYVNSEHDLNPKGDGILYHTNWGFINAPTSEPRNTWYRTGGGYSENEEFKTYEEALEMGLQEALKLIS